MPATAYVLCCHDSFKWHVVKVHGEGCLLRLHRVWESGVDRQQVLECRKLMTQTAFEPGYTAVTKDGAEWIVKRGDIRLVGLDYMSIAIYDDLTGPHVALLTDVRALAATLSSFERDEGSWQRLPFVIHSNSLDGHSSPMKGAHARGKRPKCTQRAYWGNFEGTSAEQLSCHPDRHAGNFKVFRVCRRLYHWRAWCWRMWSQDCMSCSACP